MPSHGHCCPRSQAETQAPKVTKLGESLGLGVVLRMFFFFFIIILFLFVLFVVSLKYFELFVCIMFLKVVLAKGMILSCSYVFFICFVYDEFKGFWSSYVFVLFIIFGVSGFYI